MNAPTLDSPVVLLVDDEPDNYDVIAALLRDEPYRLLYAHTAATALQQLETFPPDVFLLDVMMPEMDGIELCRILKSHPVGQHVPIVMVTALGDKATLARCFEAGADDFICKPLSGRELRARLGVHLRLRAQLDHSRWVVQCQEKALNTLRRMLTTTFSHELRTPLAGIIGPLELLREEPLITENPATGELVEILVQSADRMQGVVERLLFHLEIEWLRYDPDARARAIESATVCELAPVIERVTQSVTRRHDRVDDIRMDSLPAAASVLLPGRFLEAMLEELLDNACKFSPSGTPVYLCIQDTATHWIMEIRDQGAGFGADRFARSDAFIQFDRAKQEQQGLGLGLAIVRGLVEIIPDAQLELVEPLQPGTWWRLRLPRKENNQRAGENPHIAK